MALSKEEKLKRRREAARRRMEKIKNDPDLYAQWQLKQHEKYEKKKERGKILPISQLPSKLQKIKRKKSRESSNRYNRKKKLQAMTMLNSERQINFVISPNSNNNEDPLSHSCINVTASNPIASPKPKNAIVTPQRITRSKKNKLHENERDTENADIYRPVSSSHIASISTKIYYPEASTSTPRPVANITENMQGTLNICDPFDSATPAFSRDCSESPIPRSSDQSLISSPARILSPIATPKRKLKKKRSPLKYLLKSYKYRANKELQLKERQINELKKLNDNYRKQIKRLQKDHKENIYLRKRKIIEKIDKNITEQHKEDITDTIKNSIQDFYEEDDNSWLCPGKKEFITKKKIRKQKRYLRDTIQNLHSKFLKLNPNTKISYSFFCKYRPFWVVTPNVNARETCLCKDHENMELVVSAMKKNGLIAEKSAFEVLKTLCCDPRDLDCLSRKCNLCKNKNLNYQLFDNDKETYYWNWRRIKKNYKKDGKEKVTIQTLKEKVVCRPKEMIEYFDKILNPYMNHCRNIIAQSNYIKTLKRNLTPEQCIVHCDFSENYNTKCSSEVQAYHFGSSRQQITLHTVVIYFIRDGKLCTQSYCTLSECLRHDAVSIWEHLIPILKFIEDTVPEVDSIFFISDSPSAQYRNRKMFYVMAKLHWHYPNLSSVEWNYTETGHGKGAPDGVGGVIKRTADQIVARGHDIQNIESLASHLEKNVPGVLLKVVEESGIFEKDLLIPSDLKEFRGTMSVHQVVWRSSDSHKLSMRRLSCGLDSCLHQSSECPHGQHIGFYTLGDNLERRDIMNLNNSTKQILKAKNKQVVKKTYQPPIVSIPNEEQQLDITANDSFWADVSSIDKNVNTSSFTDAFLKALKNNDDTESSGEEYNIFDYK